MAHFLCSCLVIVVAAMVATTTVEAATEESIPIPSASQVEYQRREIVAITHFNMATFYKNGDPACDPGNWATSQLPSSFKPTNLNITNWIESYKAVGAKSGILTAKHGCGFLLWPTNVTLPNGKNYGYHVGGPGGIGVDVVQMYVDEMNKAGIPHSFYYSLKDSYYMNAIGDNVKPSHTLIPGQLNVTQQQFEDISIAAVTELWSRYGSLAEVWFDGGISSRIKPQIVALLQKYQPDAITMGAGTGPGLNNEVDWVGTESGEPKYPVWSTGCTAPGAGWTGESPKTATQFCPKCADCTLQAPDVWFWMPNTPIKSLTQLQEMYHKTVGQNAVMELDFAIDRTGNVDPSHAQRYKEFGDWIRSCYSTPVAASSWALSNTVEVDVHGSVDRVILQEDLTRGQRVTEYTVEAQLPGASDWVSFSQGSAIGNKHIDISSDGAKNFARFRLTIVDGVGLPANVSISAFASCN